MDDALRGARRSTSAAMSITVRSAVVQGIPADRRDVARRDVVVVDDHLLPADPPPLDQETVTVDHQWLARPIGVIVVELVLVGPVLVETAVAGHHLTAAQRAPLHVAARMVVTTACDSAVAAAKTKRTTARLGPVGDHLDGTALDVESVDRARIDGRHLLRTPSTDRHHATSATRRWAMSRVTEREQSGSNRAGIVPPRGRGERACRSRQTPLEEADASSDTPGPGHVENGRLPERSARDISFIPRLTSHHPSGRPSLRSALPPPRVQPSYSGRHASPTSAAGPSKRTARGRGRSNPVDRHTASYQYGAHAW